MTMMTTENNQSQKKPVFERMFVLFALFAAASDVFVGLSNDGTRVAVLDVDQATFSVNFTVCCGMEFGGSSPTNTANIGVAVSTLTDEVITLFRPLGKRNMTVAVIDPCSGATDYDPTFLLDDSADPMPIAVDPSTGFVYMLQTYSGASWSLYRLDLSTKQQILIRRFTETGLVRCRDLAFNPTASALIYGIQTDDAIDSPSYLMAIDKTSGEFVFQARPIGQRDVHSLAFNSSGTLFGFRRSATQTQVFTIDPVQFTSAIIASVTRIANVRTTVAVPRSFSNCLLPFSTTGPSGHVLLSDNLGGMVRYSKTPEFLNRNQIPLTTNMIRNSGVAIPDYGFFIASPLGTTQLRIDRATRNGRELDQNAAHTESNVPWTVSQNGVQLDIDFGDYEIAFTALRSNGPAMRTVALFSFVDPSRITTTATTTTKTSTTTTRTTTTPLPTATTTTAAATMPATTPTTTKPPTVTTTTTRTTMPPITTKSTTLTSTPITATSATTTLSTLPISLNDTLTSPPSTTTNVSSVNSTTGSEQESTISNATEPTRVIDTTMTTNSFESMTSTDNNPSSTESATSAKATNWLYIVLGSLAGVVCLAVLIIGVACLLKKKNNSNQDNKDVEIRSVDPLPTSSPTVDNANYGRLSVTQMSNYDSATKTSEERDYVTLPSNKQNIAQPDYSEIRLNVPPRYDRVE